MSNDSIFFDRQTLKTGLRLNRAMGRSNPRRLGLTEGLMGLHRVVFRLVQIARRLDDLFYDGYRDVEIESPIFIVANPRSGTTFLHRLLCLDDQFVYPKLYHTIFPAISIFELIEASGRVDRLLDGLLEEGVESLEETVFGGWEEIHPLGFDRAEEDEGLFVLALLSAGLYLLFPEVDELPRPAAIDDLEPETRRRVMAFYEESLQRLMYHEGPDRRFLGKTVLVPGRIHSMLERFPDARFVHLVRHPYETIPSFVSMFRAPWRFHSPGIEDDSPRTRRLADLAIDYYRRMHEARPHIPEGQLETFRFSTVVGDPRSTVDRIYEWLDLSMSDETSRALDREIEASRDYESNHQYSIDQFGLTRGEIYTRLRDVFDYHGFEP